MGDRILHTLAPGFGLNTTLMSFRDSSDYDPSKQASKTTGANFQLGVGPVVMLFGGKVSATYGWNLMADRKRAYWGLGFSFLEIAKIFKK